MTDAKSLKPLLVHAPTHVVVSSLNNKKKSDLNNIENRRPVAVARENFLRKTLFEAVFTPRL